ncbi:MAG: hypothetical protein GXX91_02420 [Verrucomicrobiaceae bacterium]|nr:hypothetical protein [Verrucomicrobiaceae bacterium]
MPILIHASRDFAKHYRCQLSLPGEKVPQAGRLDSWSAHFVQIGRNPAAVMMNDATLWAILIPATGITTLETFLPLFLGRVAEVWAAHGAEFNPLHQSLAFFSRSNRSLIGSMNDAILQVRRTEELARLEGLPMDWAKIESNLNGMPYGALQYDRPKRRMAALLAEQG